MNDEIRLTVELATHTKPARYSWAGSCACRRFAASIFVSIYAFMLMGVGYVLVAIPYVMI